MKRRLKDRLWRCVYRWLNVVPSEDADLLDHPLKGKLKRYDRLIVLFHEEKIRAEGLESRVLELEPALAECVAGHREIIASFEAAWPDVSATAFRDVANGTLARLQILIPDERLPWARYPVQTVEEMIEAIRNADTP